MRKLYPFQEDAVMFHMKHHYSLNCSEMGLGKSLIALETAKRVGGKVAIFGPAFLQSTWENEGALEGVVFKYFPYSMLHKLDHKLLKNFDFWIADECHYLKTPTAKRTEKFYDALARVRPNYFVGLTGTPIKNRVPDFWTLLGFCGLNDKGTSGIKLTGDLKYYKRFSRYFCNSEFVEVPGRTIEKFVGIKAEKLEEFKTLLKGKFIRYRVDTVLKDLPELIRKEVKFKLNDVIGLEEDFQNYMSGGKYNIKAKTVSAALKAKSTAEYCNSLMEGGSGPIVVFTDHVDSAQILSDNIKNSALITGKVQMDTRNDIVKKFQSGRVNSIVATIGSLSVGVTLTASRHVIFNDLSWIPADNLQAEKRIHRIGQKDVCFAHYVDATPTDGFIRRTLFSKMDAINKVVE